jgi:hypothetical protein
MSICMTLHRVNHSIVTLHNNNNTMIWSILWFGVPIVLIWMASKMRAANSKSKTVLIRGNWNYNELKEATKSIKMPFMVVDLNILEQNVRNIAAEAKKYGKTIRIAT